MLQHCAQVNTRAARFSQLLAAQIARALGLDEALPVATERLKEQRDVSVRNVNAWWQDTQDDLARYRANAATSLQVDNCFLQASRTAVPCKS